MQLYLDSFAAFLKIKNGQFCVRLSSDGDERLFAPAEVSAILLTKGTAASSDAFLLAIEHEIPVLLIDAATHFPLGQVSSGRFGSISTIRKNQAFWSRSSQGMAWMATVLSQKIDGQKQLLNRVGERLGVKNDFPETEKIMSRLAREFEKWAVEKASGFLFERDFEKTAAEFRGREGTASRLYFQQIARLLPAEWAFSDRSKRPALDPFSALLNYLYGMLYCQIELVLIRAGIDPAMGVLHIDRHDRPTFVWDFIERWRAWADEIALERLVFAQKITPADFSQNPENGGFWLAASGKTAVIEAFLSFLDEKAVPTASGKMRRRSLLGLEAQALAQVLKNFGG